jgi:hypothetical protein
VPADDSVAFRRSVVADPTAGIRTIATVNLPVSTGIEWSNATQEGADLTRD